MKLGHSVTTTASVSKLAVSKLADQSKLLAQRLALLEERVSRGEPEAEERPPAGVGTRADV